jgi:hypothetical protein
MSIVMGKANGTMYYGFLCSWSCWANNQMLGEDYWSIQEIKENQDHHTTCWTQVVSMNEIVYSVVTTAVELLMDILWDL